MGNPDFGNAIECLAHTAHSKRELLSPPPSSSPSWKAYNVRPNDAAANIFHIRKHRAAPSSRAPGEARTESPGRTPARGRPPSSPHLSPGAPNPASRPCPPALSSPAPPHRTAPRTCPGKRATSAGRNDCGPRAIEKQKEGEASRKRGMEAGSEARRAGRGWAGWQWAGWGAWLVRAGASRQRSRAVL